MSYIRFNLDLAIPGLMLMEMDKFQKKRLNYF